MGFIIAFVFIIFPGIILRRLYYYGEFSKQYSSGLNLVKLIAVSTIPGIVNLVSVFFFYKSFISYFNVESIINTFKDLINPEYHLNSNDSTIIKQIKDETVLPFLTFLYSTSIIVGLLSGRLIRITRVDTRIKLLRFKNYWFYIFSGELIKLKKIKHPEEGNKKHLFTVADILVESAGGNQLYTGVVVDYEISEADCQVLSKVVLQHAERFKLIDGRRIKVKIPGHFFVVDCTKMQNINLTYIYENGMDFLESKFPTIIDNFFSLLTILILPFFYFKTDFIGYDFYTQYFNYSWYEKILCYFFVIQIITIFNPFIRNKKDEKYEYVGLRILSYKFLVAIVLLVVLYILL